MSSRAYFEVVRRHGQPAMIMLMLRRRLQHRRRHIRRLRRQNADAAAQMPMDAAMPCHYRQAEKRRRIMTYRHASSDAHTGIISIFVTSILFMDDFDCFIFMSGMKQLKITDARRKRYWLLTN